MTPGHLDSVSKELWISVFNSTDCCKIISVTNDIHYIIFSWIRQELKPQSHIHDFGPGRAAVHPDLASR